MFNLQNTGLGGEQGYDITPQVTKKKVMQTEATSYFLSSSEADVIMSLSYRKAVPGLMLEKNLPLAMAITKGQGQTINDVGL